MTRSRSHSTCSCSGRSARVGPSSAQERWPICLVWVATMRFVLSVAVSMMRPLKSAMPLRVHCTVCNRIALLHLLERFAKVRLNDDSHGGARGELGLGQQLEHQLEHHLPRIE